MRQVEIAIVGGGAAGLTAAIYAAREKRSSAVIDDYPGGQILWAEKVDNYPGIPGISGEELAQAFRRHAEDQGAVWIESTIDRIAKQADGSFLLSLHDGTENDQLQAQSVIYAAGCKHRLLGIEGETRLTGHGVSYCASCDAAFYPGKTVAVIGGGNTALGDALILSRIAKTVYVIHRRDAFRASAELVDAAKRADNIHFILNAVPEEICGENSVSSVILRDTNSGEKRELAADGIFVAVGMNPDTEILAELAERDKTGYVIADESGTTSCPGLFAAGDVRTKQLRQVITAAADGANCVASAEEWLTSRKV